MLECKLNLTDVSRSILLAVTLLILVGSLGSAESSAYYSLIKESKTKVTLPPVFLEAGNASSSTVYANNTSAKVRTVAPAPTPKYYPNNYNVTTGTYLSGNVPASVNAVDTNYFIVKSAGTATSPTLNNPSNYNLLGSTTLVSGSISNLTSNDGVRMTFRSYRNEYIKYATISGAVRFSNPANVQGAPDGVGASISGGNDNDCVYGEGFATETGNIGQVIIRMRYYVTTASTSDRVRLSYQVSGVEGATSSGYFLPTATSWTNVDVDVTADRSWTWTNIANTRVYCDYDKVGGPDTWIIYVDVLHVIVYSSYVSEVEFTGASNTYQWAQLDWSIDSAWTIASVTVTLQLYNFQTDQYPNSGDGYLSYTSTSSPDTDEARSQTITTNLDYFRDASGNWKIKVKGEKITATQFDFKADWIEFKPRHYGEYTVSTEFLFSSMTKNVPTQLNFTVVSEYEIASVNATIQVWNYSSSDYAQSGSQGYLTYISSDANETKYLNITTNPQFHVSNGNARIRIFGVFAATTQYQQKVNLVKLVYSYSSSSSYNYVLKIVNNVSDMWKIRLKAYPQSNIGRLTNCTIYFRNASDGISGQVYVINGAYAQQTGLWCDLPASPAERYIAVTLQANNSEVSYVYVYLEILVPNKTTYAQYVITFEIT